MNRHHVLTLLAILPLAALSGCFQTAQVRGTLVLPIETHRHTTVTTYYEPPPFSPANGYRYRYYDNELLYDAGFGAYVVIGSPGLYFYNGHYVRYYDNRWQTRNRLQEVWRPAGERGVPRKLRERHARRHHAEEHREERRRDRHERRHEERHERHEHRHDDAPRHGHHRRYQGYDLTYDADIGVYRINKRPGIYLYNDRYLRRHRGAWQSSNKLNGVWQPAERQQVPDGLLKREHRKKEKHERDGREERRDDRQQQPRRNQLQDVWRP